MAITVTNRNPATAWSGTDATSYDWSLSGLTTSRWLVIDVYTEQASGFPAAPTCSGGGLTYYQEKTVTSHYIARLTRVYAWNPDQTAFTLTTNIGTTQLQAMIVVNEIDGADLTDPFVASYSDSGTGTTATVTMSAYADAGNRYLYTQAKGEWSSVTPEGTELCDFAIASGGSGNMESQWHASTQDTTPSGTFTSIGWRCIASEIAVAGGAPPAGTATDPFGMSGFFGA